MSGAAQRPPRSLGRVLLVVLPLLVFAALAVLFLVRLEQGGDPSAIPSALIGRPAPATELPPVEGTGRPGLSAADLRGTVTLVNVWASWCAPCRIEHPMLMRLAADSRIRLVGINQKDQPENAAAFLADLGNPFAAIGADRNGRASIDWGVYGVPETFLLGRDGTIRYKQIGPISEDNLPGLTAAIEAALAP
ncbi:DsbE family thiol:disulfide interchange protein [Prosthecomicrobium pneumaticum]|uniref:Cytochrome c biogenesis protein CcmG/thiol:disulfide interchange protein DsbE n=1 Tax=Prosthecomicrobium pneumaticum TaxID=81895 RepID=A0A7W9L2Q5_9HYPH|nr:DsbE family thiol:disulfide interchange protein [Prosthecomicrobium pneumaticum]MBB5753770.1 cytochrome c biogenesis protein CcmG/thiol:disulfide interchange protein DsbE [Prosthecomicrobium pneumaticum]